MRGVPPCRLFLIGMFAVFASSAVPSILAQDAPSPKLSAKEQDLIHDEIAMLKGPTVPMGNKIASCRKLGMLGPKAAGAVPALIDAATHPIVFPAAADALRAVGSRAAKPLAVAIRDGGPEQRAAAARVLSRMSVHAIPALGEISNLLRSNEPAVRARACEVCEGLGSVAVELSPLIHNLTADDDDLVRRDAVRAMIRLAEGPWTAPPTLVSPPPARPSRAVLDDTALLTSDAKDAVKIAACKRLAQVGPAAHSAIPALIQVLPRPDLSDSASAALRAIGPASAEPLAITMRTGNWRMRHAAVLTLAGMGKDAKPALYDVHAMLRSDDVALRGAACEICEGLGPVADECSIALKFLLDDRDAEVQNAAYTALARVEGSRLVTLLSDADPKVAQKAFAALLGAGLMEERTTSVLSAVLTETGDGDPERLNRRRALAFELLVRQGDTSGDIAARVLEALKDPRLTDVGLDIIAQVAPRRLDYLPRVEKLVDDPTTVAPPFVRVLGLLAANTSNAPEEARRLTPLLDHRDPVIRAAAAEALAHLGAPARPAIPRLIKMLTSQDNGDVTAAGRALGVFGHDADAAIPVVVGELRRRIREDATSDTSAAEARAAYAEVLARLAPDSPDAAAILMEAVQHKDWAVRERLAPALSHRKDKRQVLVAGLTALASRAPDELVRINARCALREIGAQTPGAVGGN